MKHILPDLPYPYEALEPYIDTPTMRFHHDKHHATYTDKLNEAVLDSRLADRTIEWLLSNLDQIPEKYRNAIRNHGGGFANHNLFWQSLSPEFDQELPENLVKAINKNFGNVVKFQEEFTAAAKLQFGSGWSWLVLKPDQSLAIYSTQNQDSPITLGDKPILNLDVWEHAYYLKYQNRRDEYIQNFWHVVNWQNVAKLI